eukprot:COSAG01_NODE_74561_length_208_cov_154.183486_1_plen_36_part_10
MSAFWLQAVHEIPPAAVRIKEDGQYLTAPSVLQVRK